MGVICTVAHIADHIDLYQDFGTARRERPGPPSGTATSPISRVTRPVDRQPTSMRPARNRRASGSDSFDTGRFDIQPHASIRSTEARSCRGIGHTSNVACWYCRCCTLQSILSAVAKFRDGRDIGQCQVSKMKCAVYSKKSRRHKITENPSF